MAHHKRKRPKSSRAGCLWCKPHKHQGAKGTFDARTVQEKRELQDEVPPSPRRSRRRNTLKWCRGKEGTPHEPAWVDRGRWWHHLGKRRWVASWRLRCTKCGKELGRISWWRREDPIRIRHFPGWERYLAVPAEALKRR